jgi:DNA-binding transcriptional ArsR family regulator
MIIHANVNDGIRLNIWQDVNKRSEWPEVTSAMDDASGPAGGASALDAPLAWREIKDVDTLRIVADPVRIAILRVLMNDAEFRPPVMSAKELAAALNEPQTKLYRHLKQLEEAGLIAVAETRLVSGIVEQRYRTAQLSIGMSPELVVDPDTRNETLSIAVTAFNDFRDELLGNARAGRLRLDPHDRVSAGMILQAASARVAPERAAEFHERIAQVIREFNAGSDADGMPLHLFVALYSVEEA